MPRDVIERWIPVAGAMSAEQLHGISQTACNVLNQMGPSIPWVQSYVTGDKIRCVYLAPNEDRVREDAKRGGFPANRMSELKSMIDPTTAQGVSAASRR